MKLIVAGATGLVGSEIIKESLRISEITSVIALARQPVKLHQNCNDGASASKLKSVLVRDYGEYSDEAKAEFADADACIWTVAVTPFRASNLAFAEVTRVCQTCTIAGFEAMYEAGPARPFRFVYFSADGTPRDLSKKPRIMGDYQIMRGETEHMVLDLPKKYDGVEVCIAQPGVVTNSTTWSRAVVASVFRATNTVTRVFPNVSRTQLAAAVLNQAIRGFEKETLSNTDLEEIVDDVLGVLLDAGKTIFHLPQYSPKEIFVLETVVRGAGCVVRRVLVNGKEMLGKACGNGLVDSKLEQELANLQNMRRNRLFHHTSIGVPQLLVYVKHPSLYDMGVIWGDGKTSNVIVDEEDDAWLIDFAGGFTEGLCTMWTPGKGSGRAGEHDPHEVEADVVNAKHSVLIREPHRLGVIDIGESGQFIRQPNRA
ncbi:hypothetical protein MKZ38_005795 [Zalerion maritima]|uniref:NAD(P)-binding domain-containing protein n=1 Tax=Zalerion maritima TaxID=339359 RepID=A0AAD5RVT3_9PEZI|nr:hypothetical protein MKZ38_005795 [Zalerion maritima]